MCKKVIFLIFVVSVPASLSPNVTFGDSPRRTSDPVPATDTVPSNLLNDPELTLYYSFDEVTDVVLDQSGNGHDGVVNGNVTLYPEGVRNGAAKFATGSYLDLNGPGIPSEHIPTTGITLAAWVKCEYTGGHHAIFNARAADGTWIIHPELRSNDQFRWLLRAADGSTIFDMRVGQVMWGQWLHFCGMYDRASGRAALYIDGEPIRVQTIFGVPEIAGDWGSGARVGYNIDNARPFTGLMDMLWLFRRSLSEDEIFLAMRGGIPLCAWGPEPRDGALYPDTGVTLSWQPGAFAVSHDVYFGDHFDDVNEGLAKTFQGNQTTAFFNVGLPGGPYPDGLVLDRTYYWRIDEVEADGTTIHKGDVWSFTVVEAATVEYAVSSSEDDGYAFNVEGQNLEYAYLRVGSSMFAQPPYYMSGMVFRSINIPQGAEIVSAYLKIRSDETRLTDRVYGKIEAEAVDNAAGFGASRHIGSLPRTAASVDWDLDAPWSAHTWYESPNIADVIQEVIQRDGWSTGNSLTILYSTRQPGGGYRNFSSCDGDSGDFAPKLEITYGSK